VRADRTGYWEGVLAGDREVPGDRELGELTVELAQMLGDTDPRLRHRIAGEVLSTWVQRGVYDNLLAGLGDGLCEGLRVGLGDVGNDTVFRRSFSALVLGAAIERDNAAHLLHPDVVRRWADRGLHWFVAERDLRGHVAGKGAAHAVAHGADLVAALARSRHLGAEELPVLLDAIVDRLFGSGAERLVFGEDDRLAYATMAVLHRPDLDRQAALARLIRAATLHERPPDDTARWNTARWLRALHLMLVAGVGPMPWQADPGYFAGHPPYRDDFVEATLEALRGYDAAFLRPGDG